MLQARVQPEIKYASERILQRIGLTMTDAMELFLRRVIVDQKLPFEIIALDQAMLITLAANWEIERKGMKKNEMGLTSKSRIKKARKKRE